MIRQKRASIFTLLLTIIFVFAILPALYLVAHSKNIKFEKSTGEKQTILLKAYEKGEIPLYYIDESAKHALRDSIFQLSQQGFSDGSCGTYLGYNMWNTETSLCLPDNFAGSIGNTFASKLTDNIVQYPELSSFSLGYTVIVRPRADELEIVGKTDKRIRMSITEEEEFVLELTDGIEQDIQ